MADALSYRGIRCWLDERKKFLGNNEPVDIKIFPLNCDGQLNSGYWVRGKSHLHKARMVADFDGWDHNDEVFTTALEKLLVALQRANADAIK